MYNDVHLSLHCTTRLNDMQTENITKYSKNIILVLLFYCDSYIMHSWTSFIVPFIHSNLSLTLLAIQLLHYIFRVISTTRKAHLTLSLLAVRRTKKTQRVDTSRGAKPTLFVADQSRLCPVMRLTLRSVRPRGPRDCFINVSMIRG